MTYNARYGLLTSVFLTLALQAMEKDKQDTKQANYRAVAEALFATNVPSDQKIVAKQESKSATIKEKIDELTKALTEKRAHDVQTLQNQIEQLKAELKQFEAVYDAYEEWGSLLKNRALHAAFLQFLPNMEKEFAKYHEKRIIPGPSKALELRTPQGMRFLLILFAELARQLAEERQGDAIALDELAQKLKAS